MGRSNPSARTGNAWLGKMGAALFLVLFLAHWAQYLLFPAFHEAYVQSEDRLIEWIGFFGFFGASLVMGGVVLRFRGSMNRWSLGYAVLLGLFLFVCAGEELSWGQRLLGIETPEAFRELNEQGELNLHNLPIEWIHPKDVVSVFVKTFGIVLPLLGLRFWKRPGAAWWRYVPPPHLIPVFLFAEAICVFEGSLERAVTAWGSPAPGLPFEHLMDELQEMYWGLAVLLAVLAVAAAWRRGQQPVGPGPAGCSAHPGRAGAR